MSRLQLLHLPTPDTPRYALVVDQATSLTQHDIDTIRVFAERVGAVDTLIVAGELEVHPDVDDPGTGQDSDGLHAVADLLSTALTHPTGRQTQLPPVDTIEGRMAHVFGGKGGDLR